MFNHFLINHLPAKANLPHRLRQLGHWAMTSAVRVFLLTIAALLGSLLLNGMVWEGRPVMDAAAALITQLNP